MTKAPASSSKKSGNIYIGVGGWTFAPWRGVFYPEKLAQSKELQYAASKLTSIEINGTYYGSQKPESFRKWAREVPDGFVFSLKGPRFTTNRRVLAEAGDSIKHFYNTGVLELGERLGPVLWQFAPTKKFDEADFGKFLELLPREIDGRKLRHVVEVRNDSFRTPAFVALLRQFETPVVFAEHGTYPAIADVAADFVYARLLFRHGFIDAGQILRRAAGGPGLRPLGPLIERLRRVTGLQFLVALLQARIDEVRRDVGDLGIGVVLGVADGGAGLARQRARWSLSDV